jgi:hypothetical protein
MMADQRIVRRTAALLSLIKESLSIFQMYITRLQKFKKQTAARYFRFTLNLVSLGHVSGKVFPISVQDFVVGRVASRKLNQKEIPVAALRATQTQQITIVWHSFITQI